MKIAFCARFLSEFVVKFITIAAFRFLRELKRSDSKFQFQMFEIIIDRFYWPIYRGLIYGLTEISTFLQESNIGTY